MNSVEEIPTSDFPFIFRDLEEHICYNSVRTSLAFYLQGLLDRVRLKIWRTKSENGEFVAYGLVHVIDNKSNRVVIESNTTDVEFSIGAARELGPHIYNHLRDHKFLFIYCTEVTLALQLQEYFGAQLTHPYKSLDECHISYFSSEKQRKMLATEKVLPPEGFRFDELKEHDIEDIMRDQINKGMCKELSRLRLKKLPSAAIYHNETNELACLETVDGIGYTAPRFTRCKYSTYKLCKFAELLLAQKCWVQYGIVPAKSVGLQNTYCIELSNQSPIWTKHLDEQNRVVTRQYLLLSKKPGCQTQFFESYVNW